MSVSKCFCLKNRMNTAHVLLLYVAINAQTLSALRSAEH
jgi:hypothetical protein